MENFLQLEISHMTESDKIKLRLTKFCYVIGFLFILWVISIIIIAVTNKVQGQDNNISWIEAYKKAEEFISKLNPSDIKGLLNGTNNIYYITSPLYINETEKNKICEGQIANNTNINFKGMCIQDGTTGVRFSNRTGILWQSEINTAATFNTTLMFEIGKAQGEESKEKGINTLLSPCVNIMKRPKDGILWESFGEEPFYSGVCASEIIKGIQKSGVIATIKHFLGNDQIDDDISNLSNTNINALMDIYVEPFYRAIHDAEVGAVMSGNNTLNQTFCYENEYLLTNILRNNLSFQGFIISDLWDIDNNLYYNYSLLDLKMRKEYLDNQTDINERFNESAKRIIAVMYKMNQMEDYPEVNLYKQEKTKENYRREIIQREAAIESQVLLKNDNILPLKNEQNIAIIGNIPLDGDYLNKEELEYPNERKFPVSGDIQLEYNSTNSKFGSFISPLNDILDSSKKKNITIMNSTDLINVYKNLLKNWPYVSDLYKIEKAAIYLRKKKKLDAVIIFITATSDGNYSVVENNKSVSILWDGNKLISKIKNYINVIVVIHSPSSSINLPWLDEVKALLFSGFPGDEASHAIAKILFGEVNPSGHLPFTWAEYQNLNFTKLDKNFGKTLNNRYDGIDNVGLKDNRENHDIQKYNYPEGLYIGQRWFNKYNKTNNYIFPFGYGLSYTSFNYSALNLSINKEGLTAEFNVTNNGSSLGQAVPMLFMSFPESIRGYPKHIFKGFIKVELERNQTKRVNISVDDHALSYFKDNKYIRVDNGTFEVFIAENGNLDNTKLHDTIEANYRRDEKE